MGVLTMNKLENELMCKTLTGFKERFRIDALKINLLSQMWSVLLLACLLFSEVLVISIYCGYGVEYND